jgi:hypothetical protein
MAKRSDFYFVKIYGEIPCVILAFAALDCMADK